ncbi:hypothetical protein SASPL_121693 [Salvia splendens]|uniref:OPA3-like protein n=1 Tax=Salvia splendens TaxID=180675 RepID=A0A8X8ZWT1_SALSN|nr:hypothetical protein SASPL_121693 [Salvia splendens]
MILPVFKLGTLALKTLCKPIGNRIKKEAGLHPRFRQSIINIAQVFASPRIIEERRPRCLFGGIGALEAFTDTDISLLLELWLLFFDSSFTSTPRIHAKSAPFSRCDAIGFKANHRLTTNLQRRIYGRATDVAIRPLNEEKAVQAAADLVGEFFVFTVAGVALVFEVQRSSRSEARKEEARKQELELLRQKDEELAREVEQLKRRMSEVEQLAKERGLSGVFKSRVAKETDNKPKDAQPS